MSNELSSFTYGRQYAHWPGPIRALYIEFWSFLSLYLSWFSIFVMEENWLIFRYWKLRPPYYLRCSVFNPPGPCDYTLWWLKNPGHWLSTSLSEWTLVRKQHDFCSSFISNKLKLISFILKLSSTRVQAEGCKHINFSSLRIYSNLPHSYKASKSIMFKSQDFWFRSIQ